MRSKVCGWTSRTYRRLVGPALLGVLLAAPPFVLAQAQSPFLASHFEQAHTTNGLPGTFSTLYSLSGGDGANPPSHLIHDGKGNIYGYAYDGGAYGYGVVFKITNKGKFIVLHAFTGGKDGAYPTSDLISDSLGNFYGVASGGGTYGSGVVYKLSDTGKERVLHSFNGTDGQTPYGRLVFDNRGNLYGVTPFGGAAGYGAVYKLSSTGKETVLYSFQGGADGSTPYTPLTIDNQGNLYGATEYGGIAACCGVVFTVSSTTGKFSTLYLFTNSNDGGYPVCMDGLLLDSKGNLYGTTTQGGGSGYGAVFQVTSKGSETTLWSFFGGTGDGATPVGGLVWDKKGNLYGTTAQGGSGGVGVVFKLTRTGTETVLHSFAGSDGAYPNAGLSFDSSGNIYGTTLYGGNHSQGVVFKMTGVN